MIQLFLLFIIINQIHALDFNINFRFSPEVEEELIQFATELSKEYNFTNQIDFKECAPHITMYLTTFDNKYTEETILEFSKAVEGLRGCQVTMKEIYASGEYFMWRAENTDCLQKLSNRVVNVTSKYRDQNYEVPSWVYDLEDETERKKKIFYCEHFGSPNVFDGFDPHFTLIVSTDKSIDLKQIADDVNNGRTQVKLPTFMNLQSTSLSLAVSGSFGTVLRDQTKAWTNVYEPMLSFFDNDEVIN